jgi:hypothetical protein
VRVADGPVAAGGRHLPGEEAWLVGEQPRHRRAQVLPLEPAARRHARGLGRPDQGAVGVRADAPAAQGRARAGPLRGAEPARAAPPRAPVPARLRLPAAPAARGGKASAPRPEPGPPPGPPPGPSLPAIRGASWRPSPAPSCAARTAGSASSITFGSERGSVVLEQATDSPRRLRPVL